MGIPVSRDTSALQRAPADDGLTYGLPVQRRVRETMDSCFSRVPPHAGSISIAATFPCMMPERPCCKTRHNGSRVAESRHAGVDVLQALAPMFNA